MEEQLILLLQKLIRKQGIEMALAGLEFDRFNLRKISSYFQCLLFTNKCTNNCLKTILKFTLK